MKKLAPLITLIILVGIIIGAFYIYNNYNKSANEEKYKINNNQTSYKTSDNKVPNFSLEDLNGSKVSSSDFNGKVIVLNFWASWCPPCISEMPELTELSQEFDNEKDAVLLFINLTDGKRETKEKAEKYISDNNFHNIKVLLEKDGRVSDLFNINSIPTTIIIDKEGYVYNMITGLTSKEAILTFVNEIR